MEKNYPVCPVCSGTDYAKERGFYFCTECNTQSQELREEVFDDAVRTFGGAVNISIKKTGKSDKNKSDDSHEWTTWEFYNYILKGMVDEVIVLGAKPAIKIIVLQLWATYLKKLEVAFTSVTVTKLPKLGIRYHSRDAELIYGHKSKKIKTKRKKKVKKPRTEFSDSSGTSVSSSEFSIRSSKLKLHKSKQALILQEYEKLQQTMDSERSFEESMRSLDRSSQEENQTPSVESSLPNQRFNYSRAAKSLRNKIRVQRTRAVIPNSIDKQLGSSKYVNRRDSNVLSRSKLLAIICIALRISKEEIHLSDVLRWVEEGALSFYEVAHFFPNDLKFQSYEPSAFGLHNVRLTYSGMRNTIEALGKFLQIRKLHVPDLLSLSRRYIGELQLPVEMVDYVEHLMTISQRSFVYTKYKEFFPNYEGHTMAFIIVVLKLLLGLDGKTEFLISAVTKKLNKLCPESTRLFVWDEWVQYIECRKAVIGRFHFPTQALHYQEAFNNPKTFIKFWENLRSKYGERENRILTSSRKKLNPKLVDVLKHTLQKLVDLEEPDRNTVDFVPSLTPQKTNLDSCLSHEPSVLQSSVSGITSCANILKRDFTNSTLRHLIKHKEFTSMAQLKGVKIIVRKRSAQRQIKQVRSRKTDRDYKSDIVIVGNVTGPSAKKRKFCLTSNDGSSVDSGFIPGSIGSSSGHFAITDRKHLFQKSEIYDLPVIAQYMLQRRLNVSKKLRSKKGSKDRNNVNKSGPSSSSKNMPVSSTVTEKDVSVPQLAEERINEEGSNNKNGKRTVLNKPYAEYWHNEISRRDFGLEHFAREVMVEFPLSFQWLLIESSRMLQMSVQDLYYEVLDVELALFPTQK